jgi:hypothetical protein
MKRKQGARETKRAPVIGAAWIRVKHALRAVTKRSAPGGAGGDSSLIFVIAKHSLIFCLF